MAMTAKLPQTADEMLVAEILASRAIEDVRQLVDEFEAEQRRPAPPRGALRSRRASAVRRPRRRTGGSR